MTCSFGFYNCLQALQNLWIGNMTLTCFFRSKLVLNFLLEKQYNKTQCLTKFMGCQFLTAHEKKCIQILCVKETLFSLFADTNSQHKHIFLITNKQRHPKTWKLATCCYHKIWSEKWHLYCHILVFFSFVFTLYNKFRTQILIKFILELLVLL